MSEEFFDIFNKNNEPTGEKKSREVVHKEMTDWHRATHIWIFNQKGEILCQQRSLKKDQNLGRWQSFFGGHLKTGQTYLLNAIQELKEELGIVVKDNDLLPVHIKKNESFRHFGQVYVFFWNGPADDLVSDKEEVAQIKWLSLDKIKALFDSDELANSVDQKVLDFVAKKQ
jgi:isopentenyldiphosphate isomerase